MLDHCSDINFHIQMIDLNQDGKVCTPIYSYFKRCKEYVTLGEDEKITIDTAHWESLFGKQPFNLTEPTEYFELFSGCFDKK